MKKFLTSVGLALVILGSAILQTQAQTTTVPASPFVLPASAYTFSLSDGTFVDISTDPNTVMLNADEGTDLAQSVFFEPTSTTDMTPKAAQHTAAVATNTIPCFPLGFDFPLSGKKMKYFNVNALGGANFSATPLRTGVTRMPGTNNGDINTFFSVPYYPASSSTTSPGSYSTAGKIVKIAGKPSAMYLISGSEGNHVLTIQYDYAVNGDEWIFQFKFHESGDVQVVVKELNTANIAGWKSGYAFTFGLQEHKMAGGTGTTNVVMDADPNLQYADIHGYYYLNIPCKVTGTHHKLFFPSNSIVASASTWDKIGNDGKPTTAIASSKILFTESPKEGRTLTMHYPSACNAPLPALTDDDYTYDRTNNGGLSATNTTFSTDIRYNTADLDKFVNLGTIVAVLSDSEEPNYTLANGTVYFKGHEFPAVDGFTPTVLCNKYPTIKNINVANNSFDYDVNGTTATTNAKMITLTVEGITKGITRYIHVYRMSYNCDGAPIYSPLCTTIPVAQDAVNVATPEKLVAGIPTVNSVPVTAKAPDGTQVMIIKSTSTNVTPKGVLAVGDKIGDNAKVVAMFSGEQTVNVSLDADEKCYFVAYSVNTTEEPGTYYYSKNTERLWVSTRAAYNGLPGFIDMGKESGVKASNSDTYSAIPFGWTRAINVPEAQRTYSFQLSKAGGDRYNTMAMWATNPRSSSQQYDFITPPIKLDKSKMLLTCHVQWYKASDDGTAVVSAPTNDQYVLEYDFGDNNWQTVQTFRGNAMPDKDKYGFYPFEASLELDNSKIGQYIRLRYTYKPASRTGNNDNSVYHAVHYMDIKELKSCLTPTTVRQNTTQTTTTQIGLTWVDGNPTSSSASHYIVAYKRAGAEGDWAETTVTNPNVYDKPSTKLTGLRNTTSYLVKIKAVCGTEESYATDTLTFSTAWTFPYDEPMAQLDTLLMIQGSRAQVPYYSPFPGQAMIPSITRRDGGVSTATGSLPNNGNANLTYSTGDGSDRSVFSHSETVNKKNNVKKADGFRTLLESVGVCEMSTQAWLITPVIYTVNLESNEPLVVRFKARSSSRVGTAGTYTVGSVGTAYSTTTLKVLVSNTGNFANANVIGTVNVGTETLNDKEFEFELPTPLTGTVQVAFYYNNPNGTTAEDNKNFMTFEIFDVRYEYKNEVAVCPELEGLERTFLTPGSATFEWAPSEAAVYYEVAYGLKDEDGYENTVKVTGEPTYTITGLDEQTTYKIMVTGYCDEAGENAAPNPLTAEFTTLESCHTPTAFRVQDVEPYGATFKSTQTQSILEEREVRVVSSDDAFTKVFKQKGDQLILTEGLLDNMSYTAQTRSICRYGAAGLDTSAWSSSISFATPVDPASLPDIFNITLLVEPEGAGTVEGAGQYEEDDEIIMTATPNVGYRFLEWQNINGKSVSKNATRKVIAKADGNSDVKIHDSTFKAVFIKVYEITVNASPTAGGTVTGAGTYDEGTEVTLTATPKANYVFTGWQKDGQQVSTNPTYKFTPTADAAFTALFRLKEYYALNVEVWDATKLNDDLGSVTTSPNPNEDDLYVEGTKVTLTAVPAAYCRFVSWQKADGTTLSTKTSYEVTMDGNQDIRAVFATIRYTVTLVSNPNTDYGTINGTSGSTSTGGTFNAGTTRKLEAKPKPGYVFVKWMSGTKELGTNAKLEFVLTQDTTITAYFAEKDPLDIKVTVEPANAGTVTGAGQVKRGDRATLTATPAAHYAFKEWRRLDNSTITANPYGFTPLRDYTFAAVFRQLEQYAVLVQTTGSGSVAVSGSVTGTNAEGLYEEGETVTLTATPAEHFNFTEWQDLDGNTLETEATYTFTLDGNVTVMAVFTEIDKYTVAVTRVPGAAAGTVTGAGSYYKDNEVTLTATANKGYEFKEWQKTNGEVVSSNNPYTFTIGESNVSLRAVFNVLCEIKVTVDPTGAGTATGAGTYEKDDEVTLTATTDDDYVFVAWLDNNGEELSTANPYTFKAEAAMNITASFREKEYYEIDVPCIGYTDEDEDDLGTVSIPGDDDGSYKEGETFTMTAIPNKYCRFVEWRDNKGNKLSENPTYTFVISKDTLFQAVFTHIQYRVTLKSDPSTTYGTINGTTGSTSTGGVFNAGTTRRLEAKPRSGYAFVKWMSGEEELGTNPVLTFVLEKDITITAYFKEKEELTITVNVNPANAGTVTGAGQVRRGNDAVLTATANNGYKFLYWERVDGTQHEDNPYTLVQPKRDYTFTAQFRTKEQYTITTTAWLNGKQNNAAGTITRSGFLANGKAEEDATITLTANPAEDLRFVEWQDATGKQVSTDAVLTFQASANASYRAVFEEIPEVEYTITVNIVPENGGRIFNDGTYPEGEEVALRARPNRNYAFDGWYDAAGTTLLSTDTIYRVTPTADITYTAKFTKRPTIDVAVTVRLGASDDPTAGTVTGAGEYAIGQNVTLTATPASSDYTFSGWRDLNDDDEPIISSANPFTFTAPDKDVHYAAVFRELFEVTLNILPDEDAGSVTGGGPARQGFPRTITAEPAEGYTFVEWRDADGNRVTTETSYTFTVQDNITFTAVFEVENENDFLISVRRMPNNDAGTVKGNGRYALGEEATLTATAATNYLFVGWLKPKADDATKFDTIKSNPYKFTVEGNATFTALFRARARYMIEVDVLPNDNAGTVTGDGEYREGRTVTLEAAPNPGYIFVAWVLKSDNPSPRDTVSRSMSYSFSASRNATYKAIFRRTSARYTLTLTASPAAGGTVEGDGVFTANSMVTITAKPNSNYTFTGWRTGGKIVSKDPTYTFQITEDVTYTAVFARKGIITVTLNVTPEDAGTVTGGGEYPMDAEALISATSNRGYRFVEWQDEAGQTLTTEANYTFTVTNNVIYTAVFEETDLEIYTVKTGILPSGSAAGTATGDGQYAEGTMVTVTAIPNAGYKFKEWVDDRNEVLSTEAVYTFEVVADITCWALFETLTGDNETVIIALKALPSNAAGSVRGGGRYNKGKEVTIEAIPAANYKFVAWLNAADEQVTTNTTYTFTAEADAIFSALFEPLTANEQELKAAFNVAAGNGQLFIDNLNAVTVKEVAVFNTVGRQLAHFTPNSNANLALPVDARYAVLVVRVVSEQGMAIYKVYLH